MIATGWVVMSELNVNLHDSVTLDNRRPRRACYDKDMICKSFYCSPKTSSRKLIFVRGAAQETPVPNTIVELSPTRRDWMVYPNPTLMLISVKAIPVTVGQVEPMRELAMREPSPQYGQEAMEAMKAISAPLLLPSAAATEPEDVAGGHAHKKHSTLYEYQEGALRINFNKRRA